MAPEERKFEEWNAVMEQTSRATALAIGELFEIVVKSGESVVSHVEDIGNVYLRKSSINHDTSARPRGSDIEVRSSK